MAAMSVAATFMSFPDNRKWAKRTVPNEGAGTTSVAAESSPPV